MSYYSGGYFLTFPHEHQPRRPKLQVTHAAPDLVKFTLTETDISVANALRRIMLAEVPTMAIEIVNIVDNETVLFDEFIAHRMGLLPLSSHGVGDLPGDPGYVEHKDCNCFDGCPYCTVEFELDVTNPDDKVLNVTHFDLREVPGKERDNWPERCKVKPIPFKDATQDLETDTRENGIIINKMKKDQRLKMICQARKGIPKYHAKFNPCATALFQYQPIVQLDRGLVDSLSLDEKIEFVKSCPRKVFEIDIEDKVQVERLNDCIFCDECVAKSRDMGKRTMVTVKQDFNMFHFTVEGVTADGPRNMIDVVRASMRILDWKMQCFLKDAYGDDISQTLPAEPVARYA